jgi:uncharacterized protein (DUF885 family)
MGGMPIRNSPPPPAIETARRIATFVLLSLTCASPLFGPPVLATGQQWIDRSDSYSARVVALDERLDPEPSTDAPALDDQITDINPGYEERARKSLQQLLLDLHKRRDQEKDPNVREDLDILIDHVQNEIRARELDSKYQLPYLDPTSTVLGGISALLNEQIPAERRTKALVRLRKYAGLEPGTTPLTTLAEQRLRQAESNKALTAPPRSQVERNLSQSDSVLDAMPGLFQKYGIIGYESAITQLKQQIAQYNRFVSAEVLPKCPTDPRMAPELYAFLMRDSYGVEISPSESDSEGRTAFRETQSEMQALAANIAETQHLPSSDYREVIRVLKKDQLQGDAIVAEYTQRLKDIEQIISREKLLSLPPGEPRIRLATQAESAYALAPFTRCPQMQSSRPEDNQCETILPVNLPAGAAATQATTIDDYTFDAASWTLAAHEIRPGHELQYDALVTHGVSIARRRLGVKLSSAEGWAVYSEFLIRPYMPPEARLISLQFLLLREARAFLDPELQGGTITSEDALNLLKNDVVLSDAFANSEVQRFEASPASGSAYFYGYSQFLQLRNDVERAMGPRFNQQQFHDFVLTQGKIPVSIIHKAAFEQFVPVPTKALPAH